MFTAWFWSILLIYLLIKNLRELLEYNSRQITGSHRPRLIRGVTLKAGCNLSYSKEFPQGKKPNRNHRDAGEQVPNLSINFRAHGCDPCRKRAVPHPNLTGFTGTSPSQLLLAHLPDLKPWDTKLLTFLPQAVCHGNTDPTDAALNSNNKQGRATENGKYQKATALTTESQACTRS